MPAHTASDAVAENPCYCSTRLPTVVLKRLREHDFSEVTSLILMCFERQGFQGLTVHMPSWHAVASVTYTVVSVQGLVVALHIHALCGGGR